MDVELNGTLSAKSVVADKKRFSALSEPPVLSRCEDPVSRDDEQIEPRSSPPSLRRETYVTRQRSLDVSANPTVYRFNLSRTDRSERRNGATAGFGKVALRLLNKREKRKQLQKRRTRLAPLLATAGRTTRSRAAAAAAGVACTSDSSENSKSAGTSRVLRPRKSEVNSSVPLVETAKPKQTPVHIPKEVPVPAKDKPIPEEIDLVDGIEILGFSSLGNLQKFTEAQEALKGPVHISDEDVDVEYFSDLEDDPPLPSVFAPFTFPRSDSEWNALFDSSDGETERSASRNDDEAWNMRDTPADEASCSSSKLVTGVQQAKTLDKTDMPKVGQVVDLGLGRFLRPESARNVHRLLDQSGSISGKLAEFSASVVTQKGKPEPKARLVVPVVCPKMLGIMQYKWAVGDRGEQVTLSTAKTKREVPKPGASALRESGPPVLMKKVLDSNASQSAERPKRKSETLRQRPAKKARRSRDATASKTVAESRSDSDSDVEEIKIINERTAVDDSASTEEAKPTTVKVKETARENLPHKESPKKELLKKESLKKESIKNELLKKEFWKEEPLKEVEDIVREMVDFVALRDEVKPIPFDPDQSEGHEDEQKSDPPAKIPAQKKRGAGLLHELRRLDVTVFDMDEKVEEELPALESTTSEENCKKDMCRLGCVCESLAGRRSTMPTHCGRVDCMFDCSCSSISYERRTEGRHLLDVSDATLAWIQDESERNLAKVERQFKQTVVRAKDDLIVMGSKRSRREIKLPERYRENYLTPKDFFLELPRTQKKSLTTLTPPITPTNKSLSPTKLITPPKIQSSKPVALPARPKFDEPAKAAKASYRAAVSETDESEADASDASDVGTDSDGRTALQTKPCSVILYRNGEEPPRVRRNIALKSTSKIRHSHNIIQSSARTSSNFLENYRGSKRNEDKLASLWNQHSSDNEVFCHIVKEHSISPEEWERSGELASGDEPISPLKKNPNSVQLIPWSFLRDKFKKGEYQIWYKCQSAGNKQKLYLTDGPTKPNKMCINLHELDHSLFKGLPAMISKLVIKQEESEDDDKDARCFIKSIGDYWMIAGYMQRTVASGLPDSRGGSDASTLTVATQLSSKTVEDGVVEIDDPRSLLKSKPTPAKAQARWWLLHLTKTFDMLLFPELGVTVKYSQIKKTATLANRDEPGTFIRMCLKKDTKFGLYGVPGMPDCVLIGPYALDQKPGFKAYSQSSPNNKRYVSVPIFCANKDSEYELESQKLAPPEWLEQVPQRVIGTWLYDFKSLELPRSVNNKRRDRSSPDVPADSDGTPFLSSELRKRLMDNESPPAEPSMSPPTVPTTQGRIKVRLGQSLLKGSDEVKAINKNTLSVKIDGKCTEALVHVGEELKVKDNSLRGKLKIRHDLMNTSTPPSGSGSKSRTTNSSSSRKNSTDHVIDINEDTADNQISYAQALQKSKDDEAKRDYIVSNIKNLGYIPVTYVNDKAVLIPHFGVPGQVHFFKTHDEVVKYVYQNVRQKITFIGIRPETISWRQVDSLEDVRGEKQFNPGILVGNHVITKAGLINLVKLTEEEIPSLKLSPKESDDLAAKLDNIKSLPLLRQLGRLLVGPKAGPLPQNAIVFMAVSEIQKLAAQGLVLKSKRKELLREQSRTEGKLRDLMKVVPEEHCQKAQQTLDKIRTDKPVVTLDEDSDGEKEAADVELIAAHSETTAPHRPTTSISSPTPYPAPSCSKEFAVGETVNISDDEGGVSETVRPASEQPPTVQTTVSSPPTSTIVTTEAVSSTTPGSSTNTVAASAIRKPQGLICKFPFSPLRRVNVTVKEDGIVATSSTNMIQLNQPVKTFTRSSDGSLIKAIKIVDPSTLKQLPVPAGSQTQIISAPERPVPNIIRPALKAAPGVVQQKVQLLRAMPRGTFPANSESRPRAVFMTRGGTAVPMTVVRQKPGDPFVKLVTPSNDKVFIASSLPVLKPTADTTASGLKVLHPNIPNQLLSSPRIISPRLNSPPKPPVIRILKPVSSSASDKSVSITVPPSKDVGMSLLNTSPATGIAEIDTTELLID